jgi:hypothetical protein
VLVDVGTDPAVLARAVKVARQADPDVAVWVFLRAAVTESAEEADAAARPVLGSCAARIAGAPDWSSSRARRAACCSRAVKC